MIGYTRLDPHFDINSYNSYFRGYDNNALMKWFKVSDNHRSVCSVVPVLIKYYSCILLIALKQS